MIVGAGVALLSSFGCATRPKRDPDQSYVRYQLGVEYFRGQRVEAAIEELDKALKADPENADAYNMLGIIALKQGHDHLQQAEVVACLRGRDEELVREDAIRKFREAELRFRKAVEVRKEFPSAWNNLAVAALQLREWDQAIAAAGEALKDATYAEPQVARANLGWAHFQKKEIQKAWKELHEAAARAPGFCVARYRLARVYVERGELDQAAEELEAVLLDKRCPIQEALLWSGVVAQRRKDREGAVAHFQRCREMAPRSCVAEECRSFAQLIQ